jgi:hypothetical protein
MKRIEDKNEEERKAKEEKEARHDASKRRERRDIKTPVVNKEATMKAKLENAVATDDGPTYETNRNAIEQIEHEVTVLSVDVHLHLGLCATGDREGLIKVWNMKKEIVREIKFTEPITAICFLNREGDLLIGHACNLSRVYARDYIPEGGFACKDYDLFMD